MAGAGQQAVDCVGDRVAHEQAEGEPVPGGNVRPLDELEKLRILRRQRLGVDARAVLDGFVGDLDESFDGPCLVAAEFYLFTCQREPVIALLEPAGMLLKQAGERVRQWELIGGGVQVNGSVVFRNGDHPGEGIHAFHQTIGQRHKHCLGRALCADLMVIADRFDQAREDLTSAPAAPRRSPDVAGHRRRQARSRAAVSATCCVPFRRAP